MANNKPNPSELLNSIIHGEIEWVKENTAILIAHGIGNQLPLQTLDSFGRGLVKQYRAAFDTDLKISHEIVTKQDSSGTVWFDNVLRLHNADSKYHIDLYEYYWANYSQDVANWKDLNRWLQGVVKGATEFYKKNAEIGQQYKDKSPFFDSKTGKFNAFRYRFFLAITSNLILIFTSLWKLFIGLVSLIPFCGKIAVSMLQSYADSEMHDLINVISEVAIYNVFDPKSKFYDTRRKILDGAVKAAVDLIEKTTKTGDDVDNELYYPTVIIAGHSLGTEVTYDAINKLNLMINMKQITTYDSEGVCKLKNGGHIADQLRGFITFGCPLDKTVFFLRENVPNTEYLRQQFLDNYHEFKLRELDVDNNPHTNPEFLKASCGLKKMLEGVKWRNYYDQKDYVSGGLDYYTNLTNIDCQFVAGKFGFTHSYYWDCDNFYKDIIANFLN